MEQVAAQKQEYKFRVLAGTHWHPTPILDEDGEPALDADGKQTVKDKPYGPGRPLGDIVTTTQRLDKIFNKRGQPKRYELLGENDDPTAARIQEVEDANRTLAVRLRSTVRAMDVRQLIEFCEAEGIDSRGETELETLRTIVLNGLQVS